MFFARVTIIKQRKKENRYSFNKKKGYSSFDFCYMLLKRTREMLAEIEKVEQRDEIYRSR